MKKKNIILRLGMLFAAGFLYLAGSEPLKAQAYTNLDAPFVTWTGDGMGWTVDVPLPEGETGYIGIGKKYGLGQDDEGNTVTHSYWYANGTEALTGVPLNLKTPEKGQHLYTYDRTGLIPIYKWFVRHEKGSCIHDSDPEWRGINSYNPPCIQGYYSGWEGICADCGGVYSDYNIYMAREYIRQFTALDNHYSYYYLCPNYVYPKEDEDYFEPYACRHLEQQPGIKSHTCQDVSWNMYQIKYNKNSSLASGYMAPSYHMYNHETMYEGTKITPVKYLSENGYRRNGYVLDGWAFTPDGPKVFDDGAYIDRNLTEYDYNLDLERGTVTLYAVWKKAEGTLIVDPAGGVYNDGNTAEGRTFNTSDGTTAVTGVYTQVYAIDKNKLTPPKGYTVSFETNGGNDIAPMEAKKQLDSWKKSYPFNGLLQETTLKYAFGGKTSGYTDRLTAVWKNSTITLPTPVKAGDTFGGWYLDSACTKPVGAGGDKYTPTKDVTLYAKWSRLVLYSVTDLSVDGGKGGVDLSWTQEDAREKTYKIYQKKENGSWKQLYGAADITGTVVSREYGYSGTSKTYTVPYSGFYTLTAQGAQGGSYGSYAGGKGGYAQMKVWLTKGEILTIAVGGKNGYNGGGSGTKYGNGGGRTVITSDKQGTLLIAGGGGGASEQGSGGAGGASTSLRSDKNGSGKSGQAGGGAGYVGGNAGEYIIHTCTDECFRQESLGYVFSDYENHASIGSGFPGSSSASYARITDSVAFYDHTNSGYGNDVSILIGSASDPIATNGNTKVSIPFYFYSWGSSGILEEGSYFEIYNQSGTLLQSINLDYTEHYYQNYTNYYYIDKTAEPYEVSLPEGTTGIYIKFYGKIGSSGIGAWVTVQFGALNFSGGIENISICGYEDGQILSAKPAYGGSNYVNTDRAIAFDSKSGQRTGNGLVNIVSNSIGFMMSYTLPDVSAHDEAKPDTIDAATVKKTADANRRIKVTFSAPSDHGTVYYHYAESYLKNSESVLSTSNTTVNTITTGIKGYYYILDKNAHKDVTSSNNQGMITSPSITVIVQDDVQYLHIAAVDKAGNVSGTADIKIDAADDDILWDVSTAQISVSSVIGGTDYGSVYPAGGTTYYVKADGSTPFYLSYRSQIDGMARVDYQVDTQLFQIRMESGGLSQQFKTILPLTSNTVAGNVSIDGGSFRRSGGGDNILKDAMYSEALRYDYAVKSMFSQAFTGAASLSGKTAVVTPKAGASYVNEDGQDDIRYSPDSQDNTHGVTLILDGEGPLIEGTAPLEGVDVIEPGAGEFALDITASDALSGLKDLKVKIRNTDDFSEKTFIPDADGHIRINLSEDNALYSGNLNIVVTATDNVGNETKKEYGVMTLGLTATITKVRNDGNTTFARGEGAYLNIQTYGYADRVEIDWPAEILAENPGLITAIDYTSSPMYIHMEQISFIVPLYASSENYVIEVRAYKDGKMLKARPDMDVAGTLLDGIRYRIK